MPDLTPFEKLQPCLLDRLADDFPGEQQEGRADRVVSLSRYKEAVRRDLVWLFNSTPMGEAIQQYPEAARSVVNFGCRNFCGMSLEGIDLAELERHITEIIRTFEPRIIPQSLEVKASADIKSKGRLEMEIRGELWARPLPEELWLRTSIDLDTGRFLFGDRLHE